MNEGSWVGLDVHARSVVAGVIDQGSGEVRSLRVPPGPAETVAWLKTLPCTYSAMYGAFASELYGVWYVVAFVWVGLHHPKRTSLALAVPASVAYLGPLLDSPHPSGTAIRSVVIAIPAAVLIGEILSATNTDVVEEYDPVSDTWNAPKERMPTARSGGATGQLEVLE